MEKAYKRHRLTAVVGLLPAGVILGLLLTYSVPVQASAQVEQQSMKVGFFESDGYHITDKDGIMSGYGYDFLQMLLRYNDWNYEYAGYDLNWGDMLDMLDSGEIDLVTLADKTPERLEKYVYSKEPIGTSSTILTMSSYNTDIVIGDYDTYNGKTVGLVEGSSHNVGFEAYAKEKGFTYLNYSIAQQYNLKETDAHFLYSYMAEQAMAEDYTNQLQYSILQDTSFGLCLGVINQEDHRLLSILNKSVNSLSENFTSKIIFEQSAILNKNTSILAFAYDNPYIAILAVSILLILIFLIAFILVKNRNQRKELLSSIEFERFVGYVCESYDRIEEIDLTVRKKKIYQMTDGILSTQIVDYKPYTQDYFMEKVYEEDLDRITHAFSEDTIAQMFEEGVKEQVLDCRVLDRSGEHPWYTYIIKVIPKDVGHPKNFIIFKKNIQSLRQKEEEQNQALHVALENAQKASAAKGQFVSKISHEIRTPLNAIIGYLKIANENTGDRAQVDHCIHNGISASVHLLDLINDVLDLSAIESSKLKIADEQFDLKEVITSVSNIYYNQSAQKNVHFKIDIASLTEEQVIGDALRVKQVLMNLLSNAVKFTPENGTVRLIMEQLTQEEARTHIRFTIKDNGIGMDEQYMEHIFTAFEQETASTARKYGGSGLGLSITKNLVDLMEGSINVTSKKGEGTEFTVVLAFGRCKQAFSEQPVELGHVRALAVESDELTANYIRTLMKRCNVKCDIVDSGKKALKRIAGRKGTEYEYAICLVDDTCDDLDGRSIAGDIIRQDAEEHPYVVGIVYDASEVAEAAAALGVYRVIEKPLFQSSMVDLLMDIYGEGSRKKEKLIPQSAVLQGMSVLLAEDNEMNMEISLHILGKEGMKVDQAIDGREVCAKFLESEEGTYQAILMDIQMPYMDGYEATRQIRRSDHPQAKTIPIIALTANAFSEDVSKALNAGMNDHISKPVDPQKLYKSLERLFNERSSQSDRND